MIIELVIVYWVVTTVITLWFLCNLGNKHNTNSLVVMWRVLTNTQLGSADERWFLIMLSSLLGWILLPYLIVFYGSSKVVKRVRKRKSQAIVEATRKAAINDLIDNAKKKAAKYE